MKKLILMMGIPGSGKSYYVDNFILKNKINYQLVCRDDIRKSFNVIFDEKKEFEIYNITKTMVKSLMIRGLSIVLDETNTNYNTVTTWKLLAEEFNYKIEGILINTPSKICIERRCKNNEFPIDVINRMKYQLIETVELYNDIFKIKTIGEIC